MEYYTSDSSESDGSSEDRSTVDLSYMGVDATAVDGALARVSTPSDIRTVLVYHNDMARLPTNIARFPHLRYLDISSNQLTELPAALCSCPLTTLIAKNNRLTGKSLPPGFSKLTNLRELNLNGNLLLQFPPEILEIVSLKFLYLGANKITEIPREIRRLKK